MKFWGVAQETEESWSPSEGLCINRNDPVTPTHPSGLPASQPPASPSSLPPSLPSPSTHPAVIAAPLGVYAKPGTK